MKKPEQTRILVVDDDDASRYSVVRPLRREGYQVSEATTGEQALREIEKRPDLLVMDVQLPDMNGLDISRRVRLNPETNAIPILQVSATFTLSTDKAKGLDAGADGYLASPVEPEELLANVRMLLRLRHAQDELMKSHERLKSVLNTILDVYFSLDQETRFLKLNPAAERLFGQTDSQLHGRRLLEVFPQLARSALEHALEQAAREYRPMHFEAESMLHPGSWWEGHIYPRDEVIEVYMRDITERKRSEQKLSEVAENLKIHVENLQKTQIDLGRTRDQLSMQNEVLEARVHERTAKLEDTINDLETFSYSITHDMRAPLRAMQGFSRLLIDEHADQLDAQGKDYLGRIADASHRLDLLIRDVLSYSNIVRSQIVLVPVDLDKLLRDIVRLYPSFQPPQANITIPDTLPRVLGNEAFVAQCFSNIIGNAVKFVAPGIMPQVEITAKTLEGYVHCEIKDNGIGIPDNYRERLFKLFHRAQNEYPGTGIGLAVVRKAAERMGGRVGFHSAIGKGSTFWLDLRRADLD